MIERMWMVFVAALIPMIIGFIWYNPKVFGNAWMKHANMTKEKVESGNMPVIFGTSYLLSVILAFMLMMDGQVIHQTSLGGLFSTHPDFAVEGGELLQQFTALQEQLKVCTDRSSTAPCMDFSLHSCSQSLS
ncbi:MAG: DUF1761 domain-containing protein [Flavobacteriales bacterium]|nr:DUF1761 domain-containing protein [Flavobacteriales bacterium]